MVSRGQAPRSRLAGTSAAQHARGAVPSVGRARAGRGWAGPGELPTGACRAVTQSKRGSDVTTMPLSMV